MIVDIAALTFFSKQQVNVNMFLDWEHDDDADDHVTYRWAVEERALFDSLDAQQQV